VIPRTKTAVKALLAAEGIAPRKVRGQHFLVDGNLIDAIVRDAAVSKRDCVLEIGTGTGILTDALADRAGAVLTCDVDARLQEIARAQREWPASVRFLVADVLAGKHRLNPEVKDAWREACGTALRPRVVSNLPYAVATPFVANLLWEAVACEDAWLLVQKEAAERFLARPGTPEYGPISVAVHLLAKAEIVRPVGPRVFWPEPKVESALLRLVPGDPSRARSLEQVGLPAILREAFQWRRKMLRKRFDPEDLEAAGIDPGARPDAVPPEAWARLGKKRREHP